ncbi:MAG: hypothetical protein WD403_16390, partial [Pirellulales bacterium]
PTEHNLQMLDFAGNKTYDERRKRTRAGVLGQSPGAPGCPSCDVKKVVFRPIQADSLNSLRFLG